MAREGHVIAAVLEAWGATPHLRLWRANVGVGWFVDGKPARKTDEGAYPVRFGVPGQGDLSGIVNGGFRIEIECKTDTGRQSDDQKRFQAMIERFGGLYVLAPGADAVARVDSALRKRFGIKR